MSGLEILEQLTEIAPRRVGRVPFLFLITPADRDSELKGRRLSAHEYITKPIDFDMLTTIINARLAGVARTKLRPKLNDPEINTLTWAARGMTSVQIAEELGMVKRTVDFHIDNARVKLGAATRIQAVVRAATLRLIDPEQFWPDHR